MQRRGGKLKEAEIAEMLTYSTTRTSGGSWNGHGQGIIMTKDGSETVTFSGAGIGHYTGHSKARYPGSMFFGTSKGKLEFLNNLVIVFETRR
jgi:hypothetical protein